MRPTLWHLTHEKNISLIRSEQCLLPAATIVPGCAGTIRRGRDIRHGQPVLRDQDLLHATCVELTDGWRMEDYLHDLASRVFFWSGWADRPVRPGRNAVQRYRDSDAIIRVPFADIATNHQPYFSRCNSGATRMQFGKRVPRGPSTFAVAADCPYRPGAVVEVTFAGPVRLPASCEVARSLEGPWEPLLASSNPSTSGRAKSARRSTKR